MARGAGNVRVLERRIRDARERASIGARPGGGADPLARRGAVRARSEDPRAQRTGAGVHRPRRRAAPAAGSRSRPPPVGGAPPRHRQAPRAGADPEQAGATGRARVGDPPGVIRRRALGSPSPLLPWLGPWGDAIEQHHERFGGGGYPRSLAGEEISLAARIVSVADSFEVMTAARSYKKPMSVPAARRELAACAGEQFDPAIVRAFLNVSLGRLWWTVGTDVVDRPAPGPRAGAAGGRPARGGRDRARPPRSWSARRASCRWSMGRPPPRPPPVGGGRRPGGTALTEREPRGTTTVRSGGRASEPSARAITRRSR